MLNGAASRGALWVLEGGFPGCARQTDGSGRAPQARLVLAGTDGGGAEGLFGGRMRLREGGGTHPGQTGPFFAGGRRTADRMEGSRTYMGASGLRSRFLTTGSVRHAEFSVKAIC